ncbi:hypothetical protein TRVA0_001S04082 [Trichomonascus vanleenenianus]|uniref:SUMO-targeted ubiquitin ligase complex subunit SLX5 n=1 Tax=Trichomonascus vanleenenianus TaxID=2268995 RepID=UPI003ECA236D
MSGSRSDDDEVVISDVRHLTPQSAQEASLGPEDDEVQVVGVQDRPMSVPPAPQMTREEATRRRLRDQRRSMRENMMRSRIQHARATRQAASDERRRFEQRRMRHESNARRSNESNLRRMLQDSILEYRDYYSNVMLLLPNYARYSGLRDFDEDELRRALILSEQMDQPRRELTVDQLKGKPAEPLDTRKGYTRGITKDAKLVCPNCSVELGEGVPDETDEDREAIRRNGYSDMDVLLSKRVFFSKCGHVYCGKCVNRIINYNRRIHKDIPSQCVAEGCQQRFRKNTKGTFTEIYY